MLGNSVLSTPVSKVKNEILISLKLLIPVHLKCLNVLDKVLVSKFDTAQKKKWFLQLYQTHTFKLFLEENKVPEHCLKLERWQGPPQ